MKSQQGIRNDQLDRERFKDIRILAVDDEEVTRALFLRVFSKITPNVVVAKDGEEAIGKVKANPFDVVFMDVVMPGINGTETFRKIQGIRPEITVVMMTGYTVEEELKEAFQLGAYGCIRKPFDIHELTALLYEIAGDKSK